MPQPKLIFDNQAHIVTTTFTGSLPFMLPFTMPGGSAVVTRVINPDSQVKRLVFEDRSAKLIFADESKLLIFDITLVPVVVSPGIGFMIIESTFIIA